MRGWPVGRTQPRSVLSSVVVVSVSATLVVAALAAQGVPPVQADLHDGGVWVTNSSGSLYSRYIKQIRQQDTPAQVPGSSSFDVLQNGPEVVLVEPDKSLLQVVDPARVAAGSTVALKSADTQVSIGGPDTSGTVAVLDRPSGGLWIRSFNDLGRLDLSKAKPNATLGQGAAVAVTSDGSVVAVSPEQKQLLTFPVNNLGGTPIAVATPPELTATQLSITAVGTVPVVLDAGAGRVWLAGGRTEQLSARPSLPVLQQLGPAADSVVVADTSGLFEVPLASGSAIPFGPRVASQGTLPPSAPVRVNACVFGAFLGPTQATQIKGCEGATPTESPLYSRVAGQIQSTAELGSLEYRVNRGLVALNDPKNGGIWDPLDKDLVRVDSWQDPTQKTIPNPQQGSTTTEPKCEKATGPNHPPATTPLKVGARTAVPVVIDVLRSVSDADCDVIAITNPVVDGGAAQGTVSLVGDGRTLQFVSAPGVSGIVTIRYVADDGRPGGQKPGSVTVLVSKDSSNHPPTQPSKPSTTVAQGGTVTYEVLGDFLDPDGDPLQLVGASIPGGQGVVQYTPDGVVTYQDGGLSVGRVLVALSVTDGRSAPVSGNLSINVRPRGDLPPTARNDYARTTVDVPIDVTPLTNDSDPNGDTLRLAAVSESQPAGLRVRWDGSSGRVSAVAASPGDYVVYYTVAAGKASAIGRLRVDVTDRVPNRPPSPMVDTVGISVGTPSLVDVLANDVDPDNDVLAVKQASAPDTSGLQVSVDANRFVRIQETRALAAPVLVTYTVTDGQVDVPGTIVVSQVTSAASQPPVAHPDVARVRVGGATTIQVLANDTAPAGVRLALGSTLVISPTHGTAFVDGNAIRYLATTPGTDSFSYRAKDSRGNAVTGQVSVTVITSSENNPPQPPPVLARVARGSKTTIPLQLDGIDPDGDAVMVSAVDPSPIFRNPVKVVDGSSIQYSANGLKLGTDVVSYTVCDVVAGSKCASGVLRVAVFDPGPNQPPTAVPDAIEVRPGKRVAVAVLSNDTDPENDSISFADDHPIDAPTGLDAKVAGNTVSVVAPSTEGQYTVSYRITDASHRTTPSEGQLSISVQADAPLLAPIAQNDYVTRDQVTDGTHVLVDVLKNDSDPDGSPSDLTVKLLDTAGNAVIQGRQVLVTLDPTRPLLIAYQVIDSDSLAGTAFIVVPPGGNQPPHVKSGLQPITVDAGKSVDINLVDVAVDDDHGPQSMFIVSQQHVTASAGSAVPASATVIRYSVPGDSQASTDVITAKVSDGQLEANVDIPIVINAANRPPTFSPVTETVEVADVAPHTYQLAANAHDPDAADQGKSILFETIDNLDVGGLTVSLKSDGTLTITATKTARPGTLQRLSFGLTDARGLAATTKGYVMLNVVPTTKQPPVALTDSVKRLDQGKSTVVDVLANDVDPFKGEPNAGLQLVPGSAKVVGPVQATIAGDRLDLAAPADASGHSSVQYSMKDAAGRIADGVVDVEIWAAPSQPGTPTEVDGQTTATTVKLTWAASQANTSLTDPNATNVTYTVSVIDGTGEVKTVPATDNTQIIDKLVAGTSYQFTVVAHNAVGDSKVSGRSATITPDALPSKPVFAPFVPADTGFDSGLVRLKWTQPSYEGSNLVSYELTVTPAAPGADVSVTPGMTQKTVTGLTPGTKYSFVLCATNLKGQVCSDPYLETPTGLPGAPATVTATPVNDPAGGRIKATWSAAADNGDPNMTYDVRLYSGSTVVDQKLDTATLTVELNGQTSVSYTVGVTAHNRKGYGPEKMSGPVKSPAAPGAPTGLVASAAGQNGVVQLAFSAPASDGGAAIVGYEVLINGGTWTALASNKQVTGLSNGTPYTFAVRANNGSYSGPASAISGATPYGPPPPPTVGTGKPSATTVSFNWSATSNGLPVTVTLTLNGAAQAGGGTTAGTLNGGFTTGNGYSQTYTLVVRSCDTKGTCVQTSATVSTNPPPPVFSVTVDRGPYNTTYSGYYIHIALHNGRANGLYGCTFTTSDGKYTNQWQRNIPTDGAGNGDNAAQYSQGTAWIWAGGGTITVDCEGTKGYGGW